MGYKKYFEAADPFKQFIKFGKKVDYGKNQISNEQLMKEHLK